MSEVRVILVGLGARSRIWREVIDADPRARIVGLVDTDPARLAEAATDRPGVVTGADLAGVAARWTADAALLVTPPAGRHAQIAAAADDGPRHPRREAARRQPSPTPRRTSRRPAPPACR